MKKLVDRLALAHLAEELFNIRLKSSGELHVQIEKLEGFVHEHIYNREKEGLNASKREVYTMMMHAKQKGNQDDYKYFYEIYQLLKE